MSAPDVVVIGAGITGAAAALELAEAGARVELIERYGPAAMASGWTLAGVRQSGRHPAELPLAQAAVALWPELADRLGADTFYRRDGNLRLARDEGEIGVIRTLVAEQRAAGLELAFLDGPDAVRQVAPALSPEILAASFCPTDGHADPVATVEAFLGAAERAGARLCYGEQVLRLETADGRVTAAVTDRRRVSAGAFVAACGLFVNPLLAPLGADIPLRRPIVTVVRTRPCPRLLKPVLGVANANMAARQEVSGRLRVTSGAHEWTGEMEEADGRPIVRTSARRIMETIARVSAVLPALGEAAVESVWGGVLDLTPDALPVIDHAPGHDNLVVAAGFSGHGFAIGPVTGPLAADLALGRAPRLGLEAFRFDRFPDAGRHHAELTLHG